MDIKKLSPQIILVGLVVLAGLVLGAKFVKNAYEAQIVEKLVQETKTLQEQGVDVTQTYTLADVSTHASETDCWMAISGNVYDVTAFISQHPGGQEILQGCGKEATQLFETQGKPVGGGHSSTAEQLLSAYQIGVLAQ